MSDLCVVSRFAGAIAALDGGAQHVALHGRAGTGKTTALQEIETALPPGSVMVVYDCYGKGRYLDASALRHRPRDAFLQLTNQLATRLRLPLFLAPDSQSDHVRLFAERLRRGAQAFAGQVPDALIVVAVDAADNAIAAARSRDEQDFVRDFLTLRDQPGNVRFIVTSRTARLTQLQLPTSYKQIQIAPFSLEETAKHVRRYLDVSDDWTEDFHHLTNAIPRVQAYALASAHGDSRDILGRLMPSGKSLDDIFNAQFEEASAKAGGNLIPERLCAGLIALPRPVPLRHLAEVLREPEDLVADTCADLAPGLRVADGAVSLADEDLEDFVRRKAEGQLLDMRGRVADRLLASNGSDPYAALNVAEVLLAANREEDLLHLVEAESSPATLSDPVLRREAEARRLSSAIKVCRAAGDIPRALRFVLMGAEGIETERALRNLLLEGPDLACRFAPDAVSRLVLTDDTAISDHGPFLFQALTVHADQRDGISYRDSYRAMRAWVRAREQDGSSRQRQWRIAEEDVLSLVEAALKFDGPLEAIRVVSAWRPIGLRHSIATVLPLRLIAQGHRGWERKALAGLRRDPAAYLMVANALALSGATLDPYRLVEMLARIDVGEQLQQHQKTGTEARNGSACVLDAVLLACEVVTASGAKSDIVDNVLAELLASRSRRIEALHPHDAFELDLLLRAYALAQARRRCSVDPDEVFLARRKFSDDQHEQQREKDHDKELKELASALLPIYSMVAAALVDRSAELGGLESAQQALDGGLWRISRRRRTSVLRNMVARHAATLLVAGWEPALVMQSAKAIHGSSWLSENGMATNQTIARLSLRPCLHAAFLTDLSALAREKKEARISGSEKCGSLLDIARLMLPLSVDEARACFNLAVEASKELDREAIAQIRALHALVVVGRDSLVDRRTVGQMLANVVNDAAIRLEGDDSFPWYESMATLAWLDTPLALACSAKWDVEGKARHWQLLRPILRTGLAAGSIHPPLAAGLALLLDGASEVLIDAVSKASETASRNLVAVAEEAARLAVTCGDQWPDLAAATDWQQLAGPWCRSLARQRRFVDGLPEKPTPGGPGVQSQRKPSPPDKTKWDAATVVHGALLGAAVDDLFQSARDNGEYIDRATLFESARHAVQPPNRVQHLEALAGIGGGLRSLDAARAVNDALRTWSASLAVRDWCGQSPARRHRRSLRLLGSLPSS